MEISTPSFVSTHWRPNLSYLLPGGEQALRSAVQETFDPGHLRLLSPIEQQEVHMVIKSSEETHRQCRFIGDMLMENDPYHLFENLPGNSNPISGPNFLTISFTLVERSQVSLHPRYPKEIWIPKSFDPDKVKELYLELIKPYDTYTVLLDPNDPFRKAELIIEDGPYRGFHCITIGITTWKGFITGGQRALVEIIDGPYAEVANLKGIPLIDFIPYQSLRMV